MTSWREHVASYRKKHGVSYKDAMVAAAPSCKTRPQSVKDRKDETKSMKGKTKGTKSKTQKGDKDFTTKKSDKDFHRKGEDIKEKRKPYAKTVKSATSSCGCGGH